MIDLRRLGRAVARAPRLLGFGDADAEFRLEDLRKFLAALKDSGIAFVAVDVFARRYEAYAQEADGRAPEQPYGLLKFDIHDNIERPLEMARMLNGIGAPGLFLMMPRHPLNARFYDSARTWDILRQIQGMGHEVGLHADLFDLIATHGDLYKGLDAALRDMRGRGLNIRAATVHGDTRRHIKAVRMQGNDFFEEGYRTSKWTGEPPEGQEFYADHVKRYSHRKIAQDCGLEYFAEVKFLHRGLPVAEGQMLYLSDNRRALEVRNIPGWDNLVCEEPFRITPGFTKGAIAALKQRPFLALLHPQWFG